MLRSLFFVFFVLCVVACADRGRRPPGMRDGGAGADAGPPASCANGVRDGDETTADCGGSCPPCMPGDGCFVPADCTSLVCSGGFCLMPSCMDGVANGDETDRDCGGACPGCMGGAMCRDGTDCLFGLCTAGVCESTHCESGETDGDESDVDCGGAMCMPCAAGRACDVASDCESIICTDGECAAPACDDLVMNGEESDVDCGGGGLCPRCADRRACNVDGDCVGMACDDGTCVSCVDGTLDGAETGVDCGGPVCPACEDGDTCLTGTDCASRVCDVGTCVAPTCRDLVMNGAETDVDCGGGGMCPVCTTGDGCSVASDCDSGVCSATAMTCAAPSCPDGVHNGSESDVDCGGPTMCPRCPDLRRCTAPSDCVSAACTTGFCGTMPCGPSFLRIHELHGGDGPGFDFIEVMNRGGCTLNIGGVQIASQHNCAGEPPLLFTFPSGTMLAPMGIARIRDTNTGLLPGEYYAGPICWDAGATGWTAVCSSTCNLTTCANFVDYEEHNDVAGRATGAPACATFSPAPFDVSSITSAFSTDSVHRTAYAGSGAAGVASDWSIGTYTR